VGTADRLSQLDIGDDGRSLRDDADADDPAQRVPATVDGTPRAEVIAELLPPGSRWWAALGPLPIVAVIWTSQAWRHNGFTHIREFLAGNDVVPATSLT
jgi:hypothetical protein